MLKAGVAIRNLTPNQKMLLYGYPEPADRSGQTAHDPLYGSCYYFENETTRLMLFCCDLIYLCRDRANELRMLVEKHTGIPRQNVMVSCTHTHSGPLLKNDTSKGFEGIDEAYPDVVDGIRDLLLEAAKEAVETAFDAQIGYGIGTCGKEQGVGGNRNDPNGACDPSVSVLSIKDMQDTIRGCVVNYSLHPTVLHAYNYFYTADYPAYIRQYLNQENPFMIFGFNLGSSGNQSSRFFRTGQNFEEAKRIGYAIGKETEAVLSSLEYHRELTLKSDSTFVTPPQKEYPSFEEACRISEKAEKAHQKLLAENAPYAACRSAECTLIGANFTKGLSAAIARAGTEQVLGRYVPIECHALRIGDCLIMGVSCEHFVEAGNAVKEASPFPVTMMSSLTDGCTFGYVCTDEAYQQFIYEAQASTFAPGAYDVLVNGCNSAIKKVK